MSADRRARILAGLNLAGTGLEIGGGYAPIAPKTEFRVDHLDHADRPALVEKYAVQGIDTSQIQAIDYVWSGQPYADLVGAKRYDWIVASHVIEHVPDPAGFVADCAAIMTENGILSLVVPDKRRCFDYFRPATGIARLVDAFVRRERSTTVGSVVEHIINAAAVGGAITWDRDDPEPPPQFVHTVEQARSLYENITRDGGVGPDVHAWAFTPESFRLVIEDLYRLGVIPLRELSWHDTEGFEFFIQLAQHGTGPGIDRTALAQSAVSA